MSRPDSAWVADGPAFEVVEGVGGDQVGDHGRAVVVTQAESTSDRRHERSLHEHRHHSHHEGKVDDETAVGVAGGERDRGQHHRHCAAQPGPRDQDTLTHRHPEQHEERVGGDEARHEDQHDGQQRSPFEVVDELRREHRQAEQQEQHSLRRGGEALVEREQPTDRAATSSPNPAFTRAASPTGG
jgi:hypothetical protein